MTADYEAVLLGLSNRIIECGSSLNCRRLNELSLEVGISGSVVKALRHLIKLRLVGHTSPSDKARGPRLPEEPQAQRHTIWVTPEGAMVARLLRRESKTYAVQSSVQSSDHAVLQGLRNAGIVELAKSSIGAHGKKYLTYRLV